MKQMKNVEKKDSAKKSSEGFGQKVKDAWANKSVRVIMLAFVALVVFTVLKFVLKF